ncbi:hypothetical protein PAECIP111893_00281 [Paenibacillus plantiphilus]|uniref:Uncharacterized protein n=1 Tax=Paenibacillus plantiphilus TaxID=2905650 RepID=A0ABM9BNV5_9BACL|nr:hypothetical protein [Paenibacillus plantiphilus]CAH1190336.1 hypothetical protein PAECIP111893_00281 [Paenibacillus plantiphilus]
MSKLQLSNDNPRMNKHLIENGMKEKEMNLKAGLLGKVFGSNENTNIYIVGTITLIFLAIGGLYTFIPDEYKSASLTSEKLWTLLLPTITTIVGYLFGINSKSKSE